MPSTQDGGIVFDGSDGTVYGDMTLQEDLSIGKGESLTLDNGASLDANGHNVIVDGGTVDDGIKNSLGDSVKYTPSITTASLSNGTVGTSYKQTLVATGSDTITWSVTSDSLPTGLSLDGSTGAITGTPTAEGSSTFTVKAENSYGSDSKEYTLTIAPKQTVSVTGVTLSATSLTLNEKETAILTATVEPADATNQKVTWSSSAPGVATVDANGKVTAVGAGTATITVTTADGGKTATCTVTVTAKTSIVGHPVDVTVDEGSSATFSVQATGSGTLTYQWQQSTDGTAWTDIPGATSASYTVPAATMEMDGHQYRCIVTGDGGEAASNAATLSVTAAVFKIFASPEALDFGSVYVGYDAPAAQTVTVANEGNKNVTLVQPSSADFEIGALSATELAPGDTATFTVQPKEGLGVGAHNEDLAIAASDGAAARVELSFTVRSRPYIPPVSSGPDWDDVVDDISSAKPGDRVSVDMDSETVLPAEVIEALAGRDVTLVLEMEDEVAWEITGTDVPADASYEDVDMGVSLGGDAIPVDVVNLVTGEFGTVQVMLEHDGPFGFKATLVAPMGEDVAGMYANLYRYDDDEEALDFEVAGVVDEDGTVRLAIDHASSWLIALDARSHALPFADADEDLWYTEAVRWAWLHGVMTGYADGSGRFGTADSLTRAQMAAVLYNVAGKPDVDVSGLPGDCDGDAWYASCVSWALETGVFNGYGDGSALGPDDPLTREQAACVLMNAASVLGADVSARADLSAFPDADEVSPWASDALSWAVAEGVLSGVETAGGTRELQPTRACTRAEMAALMMNLSARAAE
ncbi:S-layer homology domain-containing protein [Collinsella tanakaei]|uniref:S-layer homology domain-containing protein n=1 Tax=Collinsella tanakaei TaxID=626935 RepID=UPI0025A36B65|nr:S-layer homology domain-containing protein [Collinsella tanakaei]MDM8245193.1 S-layer homology domain-containing protein [Collinsella tanakaei]